jgi:hypothetical protein
MLSIVSSGRSSQEIATLKINIANRFFLSGILPVRLIVFMWPLLFHRRVFIDKSKRHLRIGVIDQPDMTAVINNTAADSAGFCVPGIIKKTVLQLIEANDPPIAVILADPAAPADEYFFKNGPAVFADVYIFFKSEGVNIGLMPWDHWPHCCLLCYGGAQKDCQRP